MVDLQQEQFQSVADVGTSSMSQSTIRRGASIKLSGSSLLQESTDDAEILKDSGLEEVEPVERDQKQFDHVDTLEDPSKDQRKSRQLDVRQVLVLPSERRERTEAQDCPELPAVAPITHADVEAQKLEEVVDAIPKGSNSADSTQIVPIDATSAESAIVGEPLAEDKGVGVGDEVELVSDFEELDPEAAYGPLGDELTSGTVLSVEVVGGDEIVTVQTTTSGFVSVASRGRSRPSHTLSCYAGTNTDVTLCKGSRKAIVVSAFVDVRHAFAKPPQFYPINPRPNSN